MALFGRAFSASPMTAYNFTHPVRDVLARARDEATQLHHEYVGTEHLLLALLHCRLGVADAVLDALAVDRDRMRDLMLSTVRAGSASGPVGPELPYTSRAKHVLELSMSEARTLRHDYVGTEHLLLGVLREERGIAAQVMADRGLTVDAVRAETLRVLASGAVDRPATVLTLPTTFASAPPDAADRAREELAWTRLRNALDVCARVGTTPSLVLEPDGSLTVSLGPALVISVDFPPGVRVRPATPTDDA